LNRGEKFEVRTDGYEIESSPEEIQINLYDLPPVMREGDIVFIGTDVQAEVLEISRTSFVCEVK
jgi:hypothetical protein